MTHSFPTRRSSGLAPTGAVAGEIEGSVVVVFALVADGEDGDGAVVVDFEQCDVSGLAEADQQFAEQWCAGVGLAAAPGGVFEQGDGVRNGGEGALCRGEVGRIPVEREVVQPLDIGLRFFREADMEAHLRRLRSSRWPRACRTSCAGT